jgi:hypothetical protein
MPNGPSTMPVSTEIALPLSRAVVATSSSPMNGNRP